MSGDRNPQAKHMADESMVRNLAAQAEAIWPLEEPLFDRYALGQGARVLDVGCGTGEISSRLARKLPTATVLGVDLIEEHLELARARHADLAPRLSFRRADAFALPFEDESFELVVCRHVSQAVPDFHLVADEVRRVLRGGGWFHLLAEDYLMFHLPARGARLDPDDFWHDVVLAFFRRTGTDGRSGRHAWRLLHEAGFEDVSVEHVTADTPRCGNAVLARILEAWRDGYAESGAEAAGRTLDEVRARFDSMIDSLAHPLAYAAWHLPVLAGRKARPVRRAGERG